jgi:hypothetical protein
VKAVQKLLTELDSITGSLSNEFLNSKRFSHSLHPIDTRNQEEKILATEQLLLTSIKEEFECEEDYMESDQPEAKIDEEFDPFKKRTRGRPKGAKTGTRKRRARALPLSTYKKYDDSEKLYQCDHCENRYAQKNSLRVHLENHHTARGKLEI